MAINLNSLYQHIDEIAHWTADVVIVSETRITSFDEQFVRRAAEVQGYSLSTRAYAPSHERRPSAAGVAILVKQPFRLQQVALPDSLMAWVQKGRLDIIQVLCPGDAAVIVAGHYVYADWRQNHQHFQDELALIADLQAWQFEENITGFVVGGDLNSQPGEPIYEALAANLCWQDALSLVEHHRAPTFVNQNGSSVIDHLFADNLVCSHIIDAGTEDTSVVQHRAIWIEVQIDATTSILQPRQPVHHPSMCVPLPDESSAQWKWTLLQDEVYLEASRGDVERSWEMWTTRWEALLLARARHQGVRVCGAHRGRGCLPRPTTGAFRAPPHRQPGRESVRLRQLRRIKGLLLEAQCQAARRGWVDAKLWRNLLRKLQHEQAWKDEYDTMPLDQCLPQLIDIIQMKIEHTAKDMKTIRREQWIASLSQSGMRRAYAYIADKSFVMLQGFQDDHGKVPLSASDMEKVLNQFWEPLYSAENAYPADTMITLLEHQYFLPSAPPQWVVDIQPKDLADAVKSMRTQASAGPGGWTVAQLRSLPYAAWVEYSHLLHLYERQGLPQALREIWVAVLPKGETSCTPDPGAVRPIAVSSTMYRLFSKAKAATMQPVIEPYLHSSQWGGRQGRSAAQAASEVLLRIECAKQQNASCVGLSIDLAKFFDSVPTKAVSCFLHHAGVDYGTSMIVQQLVEGMKRRWRLPGRILSSYIKTSRGLAQGCTLSVMLANVIVSTLLKFVLRDIESSVFACAYIDDLIFLTDDPHLLNLVWERLNSFTNVIGLRINKSKTFVFATRAEQHALWQLSGTPGNLQIKSVFTYLGVLIAAGPPSQADQTEIVKKASEHSEKSSKRLGRIKALPLAPPQRSLLIGAAVTAGLMYAPWLWTWTAVQWSSYKTMVLAAISGHASTHPRAAREVLLFLLHRGHRLDHNVALADASARWLSVMHGQDPDRLIEVWHGGAVVDGVVTTLRQHILKCGLTETSYLTWQTARSDEFDMVSAFAKHTRAKVWHLWREHLRAHLWQSLMLRRPVFQGIDQVHRRRTLKFYNTLTPRDKGVMRALLADGLLTRTRWFKDLADQLCPACGVPESPAHVLWHCESWTPLRQMALRQVQHLPMVTTHCGVLCHDQPHMAEALQKQLFYIAQSYIGSRTFQPLPVAQPRHGPEDLRPRVPLRRVSVKTSIAQVPTLPPRPWSGLWHGQQHSGPCVRSPIGWKFRCQRCHTERLWHKRHLIKICPGQHKGSRVAPPPGFTKQCVNDIQRIVCQDCGASALWCSKNRFTSKHHCKQDQEGAVLHVVPPLELKQRELFLGFVSHNIEPCGPLWRCTVCHKIMKRKQSLQQSWCDKPHWASAYKYA